MNKKFVNSYTHTWRDYSTYHRHAVPIYYGTFYIISQSIYLNVSETSPGVTYIINTVSGYQCPLQKSFKQPLLAHYTARKRRPKHSIRLRNSINITATTLQCITHLACTLETTKILLLFLYASEKGI